MAIKPKQPRAEPRTAIVAGCVSPTVKRLFQALCESVGTTESDAIAQLIDKELAEFRHVAGLGLEPAEAEAYVAELLKAK